jgi:hypothetical protein
VILLNPDLYSFFVIQMRSYSAEFKIPFREIFDKLIVLFLRWMFVLLNYCENLFFGSKDTTDLDNDLFRGVGNKSSSLSRTMPAGSGKKSNFSNKYNLS